MRLIVKYKDKFRLNLFVDWLINMVEYALILTIVSLVFKETIQIDSSYFGLWGLVVAVIIYLLNKTVKPIIVWLTLPITGLTMGLFYPFVNVIILKLTDLILGSHFEVNGIWMTLLVAILISTMNILIEKLIVEPLIRKEG
jgi:putative membrane protein